METMVVLARGAVNDRQWSLAYQIASQVDDLFPAGTDVSRRSYGERDEYTNLTWIAGHRGDAHQSSGRRPAHVRALRPRRPVAADPCQGLLLGRAPPAAAGQAQQSSAFLELAAAGPDQFYGQPRSKRLGRTPPIPMPATPAARPSARPSPAGRSPPRRAISA